MKNKILIVLTSFFFSSFACAHEEVVEVSPGNFPDDKLKQKLMEYPIRRILEEYYKDKSFYIGVANHQRLFGELSTQIMDREFSYATPANDFKQSYIHPTLNDWRWQSCEDWIAHSKENNQILRLHSPISPQCSKWAREDNRTAEELDQMLREYMIALCTKYGMEPSVKWMDVVNETISVQDIKDVRGDVKMGDWFGPRVGIEKWENPWTILGYDEESDIRVPLYIDRAFEISNKYAPKVKQIINQHGAFEEVVWEKMKKLVHYLREVKGRKVDGIGWQAHIDLGWEKIPGNIERLTSFIKWCHQNNLEFHITEMNVWLKTVDLQMQKEQADTFGAVLDVLLSNMKTGTVALNFWNVRDEDTSNPDLSGTLWNNKGEPKPAYFRVKEELIKHIELKNY